jgi:hypothetical protein
LGCAVKRGDEGTQFVLFDILKLIDKHDQRSPGGLSSQPDRFKKVLKITLKIAIVGKTGLRIKINTYLPHLAGSTEANAFDCDADLLTQFVTTGKFRRLRARSRSIRIGNRIHKIRMLSKLSEFTR